MQGKVRPAAVAGSFYPADEEALRVELTRAFRAAEGQNPAGPPKAIIVPHAGYMYSGAVAASAYACLAPVRDAIRRVVLLGPSHRVPVHGLAASSADAFVTPLGLVAVDGPARETVLALPQVEVNDHAHAAEHSLEVHLPFLQVSLADFTVLPLLVGTCLPAAVAGVLDAVWGGPETLIVVSTDLSHYHDRDTAIGLDARTAAAIEASRPEEIDDYDACGAYAVRGLLAAALAHQLGVRCLDLRNSGDTAGPSERVVGYGSFALA